MEQSSRNWSAGCGESYLSGVGSAGRKPPAVRQQGAVLRLQIQPYRRPPCRDCGQAPRRPGFPTCVACAARAIARQQAHVDAAALATQAYVRPAPPAPPPTSPGRPAGPCPRCGGAWLDLSGAWHCRSCGFDAAAPDGPRRMTWLYPEPEPDPAPPAPVPSCQVCGPTTWVDRGDGSTACRLCGAVRS
jgi:hypothetical protein